ncbi:MAG: Crp/Fnr family transcriptional regulator [Gammaproteobacteria bacterium]|nr:Crp/Fnr family transcriptional regulator [Gammaproteobacteria bacterium]
MKNRPSDPRERELLDRFRCLSPEQQDTLVAFAAFLAERADTQEPADQPLPPPESIPRPAQESVVKAIKRLTHTYPMVERSKVLGETSDLVSQHVLQGRDAAAVIDDLEQIFRRHYERLVEERGANR